MCSTTPDDVLTSLEAALDTLLATDPTAVAGDGPALDRVRALTRLQAKITAALTGAVRVADTRTAAEHDGLKSTASWLRAHTRISGAGAARLVRHGRVLPQLPALAAAYAAGQIGPDAVDAIAPIATPANLARAAAQGIDLTQVQTALLGVATRAPHRDLLAAVGHYLARLDPDGAEPDPTESRALSLARTLAGAWSLTGALDDLGGEKVATALESLATASRVAGDTRTRAQTLADALVQLADLALASGQLPVLRTVKPQLIVRIDGDDLMDPATGPHAATTGSGGTTSAARARQAACDSAVTRIVLSPDGLPLDVGREHRVVPPHLRKAVVEREDTCVFTGCSAPQWWCEVHHLVHWLHGGQTSLKNSALLCERHHTKVHHGFRVERDDTAPPGHRWRTYRPDGTEIILGTPLLV